MQIFRDRKMANYLSKWQGNGSSAFCLSYYINFGKNPKKKKKKKKKQFHNNMAITLEGNA